MERLKEIGCEVYRTDMNGEVDIEVKKDGRIMVESWNDGEESGSY